MKASWFRHDFVAMEDERLCEIQLQFGSSIGYSVYFKLIEIMCKTDGHCITYESIPSYSYRIRESKEVISALIKACVDNGLFFEESGKVYSERLLKDLSKFDQISETNRQNVMCRYLKKEPSQPPKQTKLPKAKEKPIKKTMQLIPTEVFVTMSESEKSVICRAREIIKESIDSPAGRDENKDVTLSVDNIKSLLKAYGQDKLILMVEHYYTWKRMHTDKVIKDDNLAIRQDWVVKKAASGYTAPQNKIYTESNTNKLF